MARPPPRITQMSEVLPPAPPAPSAFVPGILPEPTPAPTTLLAVQQAADGTMRPVVRPVRIDVPLVEDDAHPSTLAAWLLLVPAAALVGLPFLLAAAPFALWLALVGCMLAFFVLFGWAASGKWYGIFVGSSKSVSLSITQALLWSSLILPALIAAFANRLSSNPTDALAIGFDPQLAWLMGIPAAGLAGAKIISSTKGSSTRTITGLASKQVNYATAHLNDLWDDYVAHHASATGASPALAIPKPAFDARYRNAFRGHLRQALQPGSDNRFVPALAGEPVEEALATAPAFAAWTATYLQHATQGMLVANHRLGEASPRDLVEGDEVGDEARTDFGKAQFLVVTVLCLAAYATALAWMFLNLPPGCGRAGNPCITALPPASQALPAVLLTSMLAYLGFKAAPSTPTS